MTVDTVLVDSVRSLFRTSCTHDSIQAAERDGWAPEVWTGAAEMGLPWIGVPETAGGSGGTLQDALAVLTLAGEYAAPIPLAETGILGGWLLAGAGHEIELDATLSVVPGRPNDTLRLVDNRVTGTAHRVPWAFRHQRGRVVDYARWTGGRCAADRRDADRAGGKPRGRTTRHHPPRRRRAHLPPSVVDQRPPRSVCLVRGARRRSPRTPCNGC